MASIQRQDVLNIFKNLVICFPDKDCCGGIDSFGLLTDPQNFVSPNFDKTLYDVEHGLFYSKKWVKGGQVASELCVTYPLLAIEQSTIQLHSCCENDSAQWEFHLTLVGNLDCKCKKKKTEGILQNELQEKLIAIFSEFKKVRLYTNRLDDKQYWLTPSMADQLNECEGFDLEESDCGTSICDCLVEQEIGIFPVYKTFLNGGIGVMLSFKIKDCFVPDFQFDCPPCDQESVLSLIQPKCSIC